jgi:hypothetical protein
VDAARQMNVTRADAEAAATATAATSATTEQDGK